MSRLQARKHAALEGSHLELSVPEALDDPSWLPEFAASGEFVVEIGLGKDPHLIVQAQRAPEARFLGFEYSRKKSEKFLYKALNLGVTNLRVVRADATRVLGPLIPDASVDRAYILFPDPWPKKRHTKKRVVQAPFIRLLVEKLRPGAILELRTDSRPYAEQMREVLEAEPGLENLSGGTSWLDDPIDPESHIPTIFETKFREAELPIHYFYYRRTAHVPKPAPVEVPEASQDSS